MRYNPRDGGTPFRVRAADARRSADDASREAS
jgi:hypothetical protein